MSLRVNVLGVCVQGVSIQSVSVQGVCYMGAYLGKGPYWQLITLCWLYFGVLFQI